MELMRLEQVDNPRIQSELWELYNEIFQPINEETPIMQSFPKKVFLDLLTNPNAIKFIAHENEEIVGIGMITDQLDLEPLLSIDYFSKYYPNVAIFYIMTIAIRANYRNIDIARVILRAMINEVPAGGRGLFFHSRKVNPLIPKLAEKAGCGHIEGEELDNEILVCYRWKDGLKVGL